MIYCVWYPSGGFGHFINAVLSLYGKNFVRPKKSLEFSNNGDSHSLDLVIPKYLHEHWPGGIEFVDSNNYSVLVDNGINNESLKFKSVFPDAKVIKVCYTDYSWPVVANTMLVKAMGVDPEVHLDLGSDWNSMEPWAQREKYFLYLRDHSLRHAWKPNNDSKNLFVETLMSYDNFVDAIRSFGIEIDHFEDVYQQWQQANHQYFYPIVAASKFVNSEELDCPITDIWTQAVVYYQIWCRHGIEVPHNDYADFFQSQQQYADWISSVT